MKPVFLILSCAVALQAQNVWFEPNVGQVKGQTEWVGHSKGAYLYVTGNEVVYANKTNTHMRLVGAAAHARVEGMEPTGGYSSYFTGRDEKTWFTGIPHYGRLKYRDVYPDIDLVYYGSGRNAEYDFIVKPGGNPGRIEMAFSDPVRIEHGDLLVAGLRQRKPRALQNGREVSAEYRITSGGYVELALADYDRTGELRIDPVLEFSTYLGGPGADSLTDIKVGVDGNLYACGYTQSPAAPGLNPFQQTNIVPVSPMLVKLTPSGDRVLYYIILNTNGWDSARGIALDSSGNILLTGTTRSANFPLKNALQATFKAAYSNGFITKIGADGRTLIYSTYFGGSNMEQPNAIATDAAGNVYVTGGTWSSDIPVLNAYQPAFGGGTDCFLAKVSPAGALLFSTYMGGPTGDSCFALAVGSDGTAIVGGQGAAGIPLINAVQTDLTTRFTTPISPWLMKFAPNGTPILSTYIGGPVLGYIEALALDIAGNIYVAGLVGEAALATRNAYQPDYPGTPQSYPPVGFFMKLSPDARTTMYASYFGGSGGAPINGIAVDSQGSLYLGGFARSSDFPTKGSLQTFKGGGINNSDLFAAKLSPDGQTLLYCTLLGGRDNEIGGRIAIDAAGNLYIVGDSLSLDFPVKNAIQAQYGGGNGDGVLAKISDNTPLPNSPLSLSPTQLAFRYVQNGAAVAAQKVTVAGGLFTASASASWLALNVSGNSVTVSVNAAGLAAGTYEASAVLTPASGTPASLGVTLSVLSPAPMLTAIDPALVPVGSDDTVITLHGSGFTSSSILQLNGIPWLTTPVVFVDANTLRFSMPASYFSQLSNYPVAVQNPLSPLSNTLSVPVGIPVPSFSAASVVNAASFTTGPVAPGEIITIFGANLDQTASFDFTPATVVYASSTQMSVTVPYTVSGKETALRVGSSVPVQLAVASSAPGIFAVVANRDSTLTLYATGCGQLTQNALPLCQLPVSATINGEPAQVLYAGAAPGLVQGANQVNLLLPSVIGSGSISIVLTAGTVSSKPFSFTLP